MSVNVPGYAVRYIQEASAGTGIAYPICAAQCDVESGFQADAVSPAGAEGPWQFLPSTFASYGRGSPFNWQDATLAYINFMNFLLRYFHGNVRYALAGYNAGPGNPGAGLGYADEILRLAGSGATRVGSVTPGGQVTGFGAGPATQPDDWSWYINRAAYWMNDTARDATGYANAIRRL